MNTEEDRILHGLYYYREMVNDSVTVGGNQLLWLARHSYRAGRLWHKDGQFQTLAITEPLATTNFGTYTAEQERPLRYLSARGLIAYAAHPGAWKAITVTAAGADRARRLHTWYGRINLWYQENKDGVAGPFVAALVALITTMITNWIMRSH